MDQALTRTDEPAGVERVADPVHGAPFPGFFAATVRGVDERGTPFEEGVPLDGHLDGDLYLRLGRAVKTGSELFLVLRPAAQLDGGLPALRVALRGRVGRIHPLCGGGYDLRITVFEYRHL